MVCGSLIVKNKMLETSNLLEEYGLIGHPTVVSRAIYPWLRRQAYCQLPQFRCIGRFVVISFTGGGFLFIENEAN